MGGLLEEEAMKCVICKGSEIESRKVDEQIKVGEDIVLVQMDILVCANCGERYYDRPTMKKIEGIRLRLRKRELTAKQIGKVFRGSAA
jgi:YgiT-type zinc finger domain-containing protein